ncbi:hypothetical protein [Shewanella sp. M-Br]|uniref:hypothetical protein n=1 Tax=Shewanella sp. M-Br TaxID=2495595 RepID=UPI002949F954|nr:Mu phage conserved phage protein [Shewanella sp. M-Br]
MNPSQIISTVQWLFLSLALVTIGLMYHQQQSTKSLLTQALTDNAALKQSADTLAVWLQDANVERIALKAEGETLALQVQSVEQQKAALANRNQDLNHQLIQLLEDAQDEQTQTWRVASVPNDVVRVFDNAARCALRAYLQDPICVAARSTDTRVQRHSGTARGLAVPAKPTSGVPSQPTAQQSRASGANALATH